MSILVNEMIVLLIEDSDSVAIVVEKCLTINFHDVYGFEFIRAKTLQEGKDLYLTCHPHVVLLDLTLDVSQSTTISEIPFFKLRSDVIVLSGDISGATRDKCFSVGASDYMAKALAFDYSLNKEVAFMRYKERIVSSYQRCIYEKRGQ